MANGNPFQINVGGDLTRGISQIGSTLQNIGAQRRQDEAQERARERMQGLYTGYQEAMQSEDPAAAIADLSMRYPEFQQQAMQAFGITSERTGNAAIEAYGRALNDPGNARQYLTEGIEKVRRLGGNPHQMTRDLEMYERNPEAALRLFDQGYARVAPRSHKAFREQQAAMRPGKGITEYQQEQINLERDKIALRERELEQRKELATTKLSSGIEKRLSNSIDRAIEAESNVRSYNALADDFNKLNVAGGLRASWGESLKDITGNQDAVTDLRKKFNAIKSSQVVNNLPPGAASDTDIALALSGFPSDRASGPQIERFLMGLSKIEEQAAAFENWRADYISEKGNEKGLLKAWKNSDEYSAINEKFKAEKEARQKPAAQPRMIGGYKVRVRG